MTSSESFSKFRGARDCEWISDGESEDARVPRASTPVKACGTASFPFSSTPKFADSIPVLSLSDSVASLSLCEENVKDSFHDRDGDRSRSFIGRIESSAPLSPYSVRLLKDPSSVGKLRDRLLRKSLIRNGKDSEIRFRRPLSNLRSEAADVRDFLCTQLPEDEVVEESDIHERLSSNDSYISVLNDSAEMCDVDRERKAIGDGIIKPDTIIIESSSEDDKVSEDDNNISTHSSPKPPKPLPQGVEVGSVVPKHSKETTASLELRLESSRKLLVHAPFLPDGGARIHRQIEAITQELQRRREEPAEEHDCFLAAGQGEDVLERENRKHGSVPVSVPRRDINDILIDAQRPIYRGIQEKALAELHKALMSQPDSKELTKTPAGFLCPLKEHQMAGLTWMKWRESLSPKGGILADEMGLGKTLLVIALIATGKCEREQRRLEGKDSEDKDRSSIVRQQSLTPSNATLIIAPAALIYHWEDEVNQRCEVGLLKVAVYHTNRKHVNHEMLARNDIVITSYTLVANELRSDDHKKNTLAKIHWSRIVLDEAHCIKNRKTKAAKAVCRLSSDARWCVTGTPVHNNLWDLYSLIKFLNVDHFSEERFWKEYVMLSTKKSAERLNLLMKNYVLRREKNSVSPITETRLVELPVKHNHDHILDFSERERRAYELMYEASRTMVKEMITEEEVEQRFGGNKKTTVMSLPAKNVFIGSNSVSNPSTKIGKMGCMLVMLLRLRQACIHFHLTKNAVNTEAFQSIGTEYQLTAEEQQQLANITIDNYVDSTNFEDLSLIFRRKHASAKINFALNLLERILRDNEKCVMVSQWTSFLKILEKHIVKRFRDAQCSTISGDVHPSERQDRVKCFNEDKKGTNVMLVSISAGGVGLNLTGGNHLILMDLHWNPALELQACDRVHRMGQTREVHIHKLIMKQSIEERVLSLQMKKMGLAENVLKGAVSKRNMNLTMADLKFLFDLESHH